MPFISKKGYDFKDFSLICKLLYVGAHEDVNIKNIIIQLSLGMNKFILSSFKGPKDKSLTSKELELLNDTITLRISQGLEYKNSVIYFLNISNHDIIVDSLTEAANLLNISSDTLRKLLAKNNEEAKVNNNLVKRIKIFVGSASSPSPPRGWGKVSLSPQEKRASPSGPCLERTSRPKASFKK